jgi:hypothetical protein
MFFTYEHKIENAKTVNDLVFLQNRIKNNGYFKSNLTHRHRYDILLNRIKTRISEIDGVQENIKYDLKYISYEKQIENAVNKSQLVNIRYKIINNPAIKKTKKRYATLLNNIVSRLDIMDIKKPIVKRIKTDELDILAEECILQQIEEMLIKLKN